MTSEQAGEPTPHPRARRGPQPVPWWALGAAVLSLSAVVLEMLGSLLGGGPTSGYPAWLVPTAWPHWLRTMWWAAAALGVAVYTVWLRDEADRTSNRVAGTARWLVGAVTALLFVGFTVGVALGAPWATWH